MDDRDLLGRALAVGDARLRETWSPQARAAALLARRRNNARRRGGMTREEFAAHMVHSGMVRSPKVAERYAEIARGGGKTRSRRPTATQFRQGVQHAAAALAMAHAHAEQWDDPEEMFNHLSNAQTTVAWLMHHAPHVVAATTHLVAADRHPDPIESEPLR